VEVQTAQCSRDGPFIHIELQASGFLYGMMRLLVGLLVQVGRGLRSPAEFTELWTAQRRDQVRYAAPPQGLCLLRVGYPDFPFPAELWFDTQPKFVLPAISELEHSLG
jgi:tRNA pseudouridine38-40 synthase